MREKRRKERGKRKQFFGKGKGKRSKKSCGIFNLKQSNEFTNDCLIFRISFTKLKLSKNDSPAQNIVFEEKNVAKEFSKIYFLLFSFFDITVNLKRENIPNMQMVTFGTPGIFVYFCYFFASLSLLYQNILL